MFAGSRTVARVMWRAHSDFGTLPDGTQTVSDVKDLLANWDPRMQQLNAQAVGVQVDDSFTTDLAALNNRYNAAAGQARKVISDASWLPSASADQGDYDAILGALKQVAGTVSKGDFDDLSQRLTAARSSTGQQTDFSTTQPTTQDVGMGFYAWSAPFDIIAQATGLEKPKNPLGGGVPDPLAALEWVILLGTLGLGGVFTARLFVAPALKTVAWLAGTVLGGYYAYKGTTAVGQELGKLQGSTAGTLLGV